MKRRLDFTIPLTARRDYAFQPPYYATTPDDVLSQDVFEPFDRLIFWSMARRTAEATDILQASKVQPDIPLSNAKYK